MDGRRDFSEDATMFCLEDSFSLNAVIGLAAFVLVFAIGLGLGLLVRGL